MATGTWDEQWDRVQRWRTRTERYRAGFDLDTPVDVREIRDDLHAAFQAVWHLKDWLVNDPQVVVTKRVIEKTVDQTPELLLAADVCNGSKHLRLRGLGGRSSREPRLGAGKISVNAGGTSPGIRLEGQEVVMNDGTAVDAFKMLDDGIAAWRRLLKSWQLIP